MARINRELIILVGRDRENPRTHREAFEITGGLGEMLDKHIKRNNLNKSEFIREAVAAKLEAEMPKEPLIKDEKIRKAVRAWWECCQEGISDKRVCIINGEFRIGIYRLDLGRYYFFDDKKEGFYTIAELCGEEEE